MTLPVYDRDTALAGVREASARWSELLRSVTDPSLTAIGHWSIGDVGTHTTHIFSMYPKLVRGEASPIQDHLAMAAYWDRMLAEDSERDPGAIADRIDAATEEFCSVATPEVWEQITSWHGGLKIPVYALASFLMNEAELHGLDVARAAGKPWAVDPGRARMIIDGHLPTLPHFLNADAVAGLTATYDLRVRGGSRVYFTVRDEQLTIDTTAPGRVDCHISADPVAYLLVGYGRTGQLGPILTGKIVAWGRKPWLGLKFGKLFTSV
jgi:uncharacterized protein (TIGR03083 family)